MVGIESAVSDARESLVTELQPGVVAAVQEAGRVLVRRYGAGPTLTTGEDVVAAIRANDDASLAVLRPALQALRPQAGWAEDELGSGALPAGEWWVTDPVEGNVNHVHAMLDWGVTGTVFHPGPLNNGPLSTTRRTVGLQAVPRRPLPGRVSRATVAAAMLDELEEPAFAGLTAIPLSR